MWLFITNYFSEFRTLEKISRSLSLLRLLNNILFQFVGLRIIEMQSVNERGLTGYAEFSLRQTCIVMLAVLNPKHVCIPQSSKICRRFSLHSAWPAVSGTRGNAAAIEAIRHGVLGSLMAVLKQNKTKTLCIQATRHSQKATLTSGTFGVLPHLPPKGIKIRLRVGLEGRCKCSQQTSVALNVPRFNCGSFCHGTQSRMWGPGDQTLRNSEDQRRERCCVCAIPGEENK